MSIATLFENTPARHFSLHEKSSGLYQLRAPIFHEDGDMMNIFFEEIDDDTVKIFDQGTSLMRLSYLFDIDTDNKRNVLNEIVLKRGAEFNDGNITLFAKRQTAFEAVMGFVQLVSEICNMDILSHEIVENLFYEHLADAISDMNVKADYEKDYKPTNNNDLVIDHAFLGEKNRRPVFLYGVKDTNKAMKTTIDLLLLKNENIPHRSVVVFQDIDGGIVKQAKRRLINAAGKVYADLNGFTEDGKTRIEEELTVV